MSVTTAGQEVQLIKTSFLFLRYTHLRITPSQNSSQLGSPKADIYAKI